MSEEATEKQTGQIGFMSSPENFVYVNSVRVYSGAGDIMMELGRANPIEKMGDTPDAVGVVGVIMPAIVGVKLAKQLLAQAKMSAPQMRSIADEIESEA